MHEDEASHTCTKTLRHNKQNSLLLLRHSYDMVKTETTTAAHTKRLRRTSLSKKREAYTIATSPLHSNMEYHDADADADADADDTTNPIYPNPNDPPPNWPVEVRKDDTTTATIILDITTTTTSSLHSLLNTPSPPLPPNLPIPTPHTNVPHSMNTTTAPSILAAVMTWNSLWYLTLFGVAYFYMQSNTPKKERMREWWWRKHSTSGPTLRALVDAVRTLLHVTEVHVRTTMYHLQNLLHGWGWDTNLNRDYHPLDPSDDDDDDFDDDDDDFDDDDDDTNSGKHHPDNDNHQAVLRSNRIQYYQNSIQSMVAPFLRTRRRRQQRQRSPSLPDLDDGRGHAHHSSHSSRSSHHHHHHQNHNIATCTNLNDPDNPTPSVNDSTIGTNRYEKTIQNPGFGNEVNTNRKTARTTHTSASRNNNRKNDNHTFTFRPHNQSYYTKTNYWKDTYETNHSIPLEPAFIKECDYPDNWMMYHPMYRVISKRQMEQLDDGHLMPSWQIPPTNNNNQETPESTTERNEPPPTTTTSSHNNNIVTVSDPTSYIEQQQPSPSLPCGIGSGIINHQSVGTCDGSNIDSDIVATAAAATTTTTPTPNHQLQSSPTAGTTPLEEPTKTSRSSNSESDRNLPILLRSVVAT
jgi:hypothetical protein